MLRIYPVLLDLVHRVVPLIKEIERRDPISEGSTAGPCRARRSTSLIEVAVAFGYLPTIDPRLRDRFNHVLGTLVRLVGGH